MQPYCDTCKCHPAETTIHEDENGRLYHTYIRYPALKDKNQKTKIVKCYGIKTGWMVGFQ